MISIRGVRGDDLPQLRDICVRTGAGGRDATGRYVSDALLPDVFAEPYAAHDRAWCWVAVDDADRAIGYLVAAPDTRAFVAWWQREWTPAFARRWDGVDAGAGAWLIERGLRPEGMIPEHVVDAHPAHLHIDLLEPARGTGVGRRLTELLFERLREAGVSGVHLGMDPANTGARAFYDRLGFEAADAEGRVLVRAL